MKNSNRIASASAAAIVVVSANVYAQDDDDAHHEIDQVIVFAAMCICESAICNRCCGIGAL